MTGDLFVMGVTVHPGGLMTVNPALLIDLAARIRLSPGVVRALSRRKC